MAKRLWVRVAFILVLTVFAGLISLPLDKDSTVFGDFDLPKSNAWTWFKAQEVNLGLDLQGGTQLVYDIDLSNVPEEDTKQIVEGIQGVIEGRVNRLGVSEPNIYSAQVEDQYHMVVELAGIKDIQEAISTVGKTVLLEFKEEKKEFTAGEVEELKAYNRELKTKANDLLGRLKDGADFTRLTKEYTEDLTAKQSGGDLGWLSREALPPYIPRSAMNMAPGTLGSTVQEDDFGYYIYKVLDKRRSETKEYKARHILLRTLEVDEDLSEQSKIDLNAKNALRLAEAKEVVQRLNKGERFDALARELSEDPGTKENGGDLGWFAEGKMVETFQEAVSKLNKGQITTEPVETRFGYHIIKLEDTRTGKDEVNVAVLMLRKKPLEPSGWASSGLTGKQFKHADVVFTQFGVPQIQIQFDDEGKELFAELTKANLNKPIAIFLDDQIISAPIVQTEITEGTAVITGRFNIAEANELAKNINTGAIPAPVTLIGQSTIEAQLGEESLVKSVKAGYLGLIVLAIFMLLYYRLPGLLANIALIIYGLIILAIFKVFSIVLTLAGVAAFILSIGMAVDANVLIFERIKEELRHGKSIALAIDQGFKHAWSSIRDSNVSSLITCAILFIFGSGIIRGFAVTLAIGIIISMFTAITITRTFLDLMLKWKITSPILYLGAKKDHHK